MTSNRAAYKRALRPDRVPGDAGAQLPHREAAVQPVRRPPGAPGPGPLPDRRDAVVGDRFVAEGMIATINLKVLPGAALTMGHDVYLNGGVSIEATHDIRIGSNVLVAPFASRHRR